MRQEKQGSTLSRLRLQDKELRKNIILDAAERVFATKALDKVNMRDIAREAGMATSSIYTYFPTQEALFVETAMRDAYILFSEMEGILAEKKRFSLGKIINAFLDFFAAHDAFFRMSSQFMLYGKMNPESIDAINPVTRHTLDIFDRAFKRLSCKGDIRILSHTLFASLSGILIAYRKYPGRSDEEILKHMKRIGIKIEAMMKCYIEQEYK